MCSNTLAEEILIETKGEDGRPRRSRRESQATTLMPICANVSFSRLKKVVPSRTEGTFPPSRILVRTSYWATPTNIVRLNCLLYALQQQKLLRLSAALDSAADRKAGALDSSALGPTPTSGTSHGLACCCPSIGVKHLLWPAQHRCMFLRRALLLRPYDVTPRELAQQQKSKSLHASFLQHHQTPHGVLGQVSSELKSLGSAHGG